MRPCSGVDKIYRSKEVQLADVDTAVAKHRVRHRNVAVDVRDSQLKKIISSASDLSRRPGEADFAVFCAFVLCLAHAFSEIDGFPDAGAQLLDSLLIVFVFRGRLPREPGGRCFDVVASALLLVDQRLHVERQAAVQKYADIELLRGGELLGLVEPTLDILQGLRAL